MIRATLHTKPGALPNAVDTLVTAIDMPPFNTLPEVVIWGTRVFTLDTATAGWIEPKYTEAFCYAVPLAR